MPFSSKSTYKVLVYGLRSVQVDGCDFVSTKLLMGKEKCRAACGSSGSDGGHWTQQVMDLGMFTFWECLTFKDTLINLVWVISIKITKGVAHRMWVPFGKKWFLPGLYPHLKFGSLSYDPKLQEVGLIWSAGQMSPSCHVLSFSPAPISHFPSLVLENKGFRTGSSWKYGTSCAWCTSFTWKWFRKFKLEKSQHESLEFSLCVKWLPLYLTPLMRVWTNFLWTLPPPLDLSFPLPFFPLQTLLSFLSSQLCLLFWWHFLVSLVIISWNNATGVLPQ